MSYDIYLSDPVSGDVLELDSPHQMRGGTYAVGGTSSAELNITYNYAPVYFDLFGDKGIRFLYGMSAADSVPHLEESIALLKDDVTDDYWDVTEGNAKRALIQLLSMARLRPDGVWQGD